VRRAAAALFVRDWRLATRAGGGAALSAMFFLALVAVTPFAMGPDQRTLAKLGPAILWIATLLATLLGLDRLFLSDAEDGSMDALSLSPLPLELVTLVKCAAHWSASVAPLIVLSPIFGLMLAMSPSAIAAFVQSLLVGTPALTLIGAVGAALTVSLRRGGLLMAVITVPLAIPTLIFGVAAAGEDAAGPAALLMLSAFSLGALALSPFAAAAALRGSRE
jgi:heme exporter protein B